ncbi:hypothetical protein B2G71_13995 [Novosphingobium sp. PC22D]|nr:hypothetical protein B2G71_13995 [Novosphingobium sp. PC22D]
MAVATGCTALLGMVAGMKVPNEMVMAPEPEWHGMLEKTYVAADERPLHEAGPEDLYVPRAPLRDPMADRLDHDAMEYMAERAVGPDPLPVAETGPGISAPGVIEAGHIAPDEIPPVAAEPVGAARIVAEAADDQAPVVRVRSGASGFPAAAQPVSAEPLPPLEDVARIPAVPQT